jgi:hypothetical protein
VCAAPRTFAMGGLLIDCSEQAVAEFIASNRVMLARFAAPKGSTVMPKPHLSYPHVAVDLDKEELTSISTDARAGT